MGRALLVLIRDHVTSATVHEYFAVVEEMMLVGEATGKAEDSL